jgi:prepilin-type N-terminal cleavage/methylation domain-containing protein
MNRRLSAGFTLIELLAAMALLATFSLLASRLYVATFATLGRTRDAANAAAHARHIERSLHADAWNALRIICPQPNRVVIDMPDGRSVTWYCVERDFSVDLERRLMVGGREMHRDTFPCLGAGVGFETDGVTLRLTRDDVMLTCVSHLRLLRRAEP